MLLNEEADEASEESKVSSEKGKDKPELPLDASAVLVANLNRVIKRISEAPEKESVLEAQEDREQSAVIARAEEEIEFQKTQRHGVEGYYQLRNLWSRYLAGFLGGSILFQFILTIAIGAKWLDFSHDQAVLKMVVGENFLQIAGMGYIIVRFLYPNQKTDQPPSSSRDNENQPKQEKRK